MAHHIDWKPLVGIGACIAALAMASPEATEGQAVRRAGSWQFSIPINFVFGDKIEGDGGSYVQVNDDVGWGFGFGYHLNERFMLGFESTWLSAHYDAAIGIDLGGDQAADEVVTLGGRLDAVAFQGVGQFNMLEGGRFTPFLQGKLGTAYTDSNIPSGPTQGACWWDPWWGYVCDAWRPTYSSWSFTYGGAIGLRVQVASQFFLEGSYNILWIDFEKDNPSTDGIRLNVGWAL